MKKSRGRRVSKLGKGTPTVTSGSSIFWVRAHASRSRGVVSQSSSTSSAKVVLLEWRRIDSFAVRNLLFGCHTLGLGLFSPFQ